MNQYPLIITNKIYWYIWKLKQQDLCNEYKKRVKMMYTSYSYCVCNFEQCVCPENHWIKSILFDGGDYNYRHLRAKYRDFIINKKRNQCGPLPKNY